MSLELPVFRHAIGNDTAEFAVSAVPFGRLV